jgi:hypothetical protein
LTFDSQEPSQETTLRRKRSRPATHGNGRRATKGLLELRDWLVVEKVTLVVLEATGIIRGSNKFLLRFSRSLPLRTRP